MIKYSVVCEQGRRPSNQDNVTVLQDQRGNTLAIVCDGVGGNKSGDVASNTIIDFIRHKFELKTFADPVEADVKEWMVWVTKEALSHLITLSKSNENFTSMSSTIIACFANEEFMVFVNCGDSRAYVLNGGQLVRVTRDHNIGTLGQGSLDKKFAPSILVSAMGDREQVLVDVYSIPRTKSLHTVLLMSDGVHGFISDEKIKKIALKNNYKKVCNKLYEEAYDAGSNDNISVACMEY